MTYLPCSTITNKHEFECWDVRLCLVCHDEIRPIYLVQVVYTEFTRFTLLLPFVAFQGTDLALVDCFGITKSSVLENTKEKKIKRKETKNKIYLSQPIAALLT
jgi:hypothetical protein